MARSKKIDVLVEYQGYDQEKDKKIIKLFGSRAEVGSGYGFMNGMRDIQFRTTPEKLKEVRLRLRSLRTKVTILDLG